MEKEELDSIKYKRKLAVSAECNKKRRRMDNAKRLSKIVRDDGRLIVRRMKLTRYAKERYFIVANGKRIPRGTFQYWNAQGWIVQTGRCRHPQMWRDLYELTSDGLLAIEEVAG